MKKLIVVSLILIASKAFAVNNIVDGTCGEPVNTPIDKTALIDVSPQWIDMDAYAAKLRAKQAVRDMYQNEFVILPEDASYLAKMEK